jgi:hypothetical protein
MRIRTWLLVWSTACVLAFVMVHGARIALARPWSLTFVVMGALAIGTLCAFAIGIAAELTRYAAAIVETLNDTSAHNLPNERPVIRDSEPRSQDV